MISKCISVLAIFLIFSNSAHASKYTNTINKRAFVFLAILEDQPITKYLENMGRLKHSENIIISVEDFADLLASRSAYSKVSFLNEESELMQKFRRFIKANALNSTMVSANNLNKAQNIYLNIIFLVDLQKSISQRSDLHYFGKETIKNLNEAIAKRVERLYKNADLLLKNTVFSKDIVKKNENQSCRYWS